MKNENTIVQSFTFQTPHKKIQVYQIFIMIPLCLLWILLTKDSFEGKLTDSVLSILVFFSYMRIGYIPFHEFIHKQAATYFGYKAIVYSDWCRVIGKINKADFIKIVLAPLCFEQLIYLNLGILFIQWPLTELLGLFMFLMLIISFLAAFGDLYMTYVALKQPSHSLFEIVSSGVLKVYLKQ